MLHFKKLDLLAVIPRRQTAMSAGYDLSSIKNIRLLPGERYPVQTGLAVAIPANHYGRIAPRSGLAVKKGLDVLAGVVDADYRDEIRVVLINLGNEPIDISIGERIAQMIIECHLSLESVEVDDLPNPSIIGSTHARKGGFGSTGISVNLSIENPPIPVNGC